MAAIGGTFAALHYYVHKLLHGIPKKNPNALKLGILSTAAINAMAVIYPSKSHPDVVLYAVASRDKKRAATFAKKYGFQKSYGLYQELLDDPQIDFVYIPLPNSLHYEWASKALKAGKHVLLEKPFTNNAEEARALVEQANHASSVDKHGKKLVLLEAFHWRFHPATAVFAEVLRKYVTGADTEISTNAHMRMAPGPPADDIRWKFELGGGSLMDCTYALSFTRFALGHLASSETGRMSIVSPPDLKITTGTASAWKDDDRVDKSMHASLELQTTNHHIGSVITTDMSGTNVHKLLGFIPIPRFWDAPSITIRTSKYEIHFLNAIVPHVYHRITVRDIQTNKIVERRKCYAGGPAWGGVPTTESEKAAGGKGGLKSWSTYKFQLEAFVKKVRGEECPVWVSGEDSVAQMEGIDEIYRKAGLPVRESSPYLSEQGQVQNTA